MAVTERFHALYANKYAHGAQRAWRDLGAVGKAENIVRVYRGARLPPKPTVVEIGCGEGAIAAVLHKDGFFGKYHGFDISESGIAEARSRSIPGATFAVSDGDNVDVEDDSVDLVILSHVMEHVEHPRMLLYAACRLAKHVVVEVPLELHMRTPRNYVWDSVGHINKYNSTSIRQLVQTSGFEVLQQVTTNPSLEAALFHGRSLQRRLQWHVKDAALAISPRAARAVLTYHETLLARRSD